MNWWTIVAGAAFAIATMELRTFNRTMFMRGGMYTLATYAIGASIG